MEQIRKLLLFVDEFHPYISGVARENMRGIQAQDWSNLPGNLTKYQAKSLDPSESGARAEDANIPNWRFVLSCLSGLHFNKWQWTAVTLWTQHWRWKFCWELTFYPEYMYYIINQSKCINWIFISSIWIIQVFEYLWILVNQTLPFLPWKGNIVIFLC